MMRSPVLIVIKLAVVVLEMFTQLISNVAVTVVPLNWSLPFGHPATAGGPVEAG